MPPTTTLPRKVHAVILDMDGLMFDTEALYRDAVIAAAADGCHDISTAFYLSTIGMSVEATRAAFKKRCGKDFDFDLFWTTASQFREITKLQLCMKQGLVELLDLLDNFGLHGLLDRFETVIARGDYSRGKPQPEPFLKAAERLGVRPESCIALEDSYHGVRAACAAGMMTIMVPDLLPPTSEMEELCVYIARDLHEVCAVIGSHR